MQPTGSISAGQIQFEEFIVDLDRRGLYRGSERIQLTPTPFKVLEFLVQSRGHVVSKEQLLSAVWGQQRDENTVEQAVRQIRRVLGDEKENPRFIQTIPGEGYCFIARERITGEAELELASESDSEATDGTLGAEAIPRRYSHWSIIAIAILAILVGAFVLQRDPLTITAANPRKITRSHTHILSPLLSDDVNVFYPRYDNGSYSIAAVPLEGGEGTAVPTAIPNPELNDLSPDGRSMLLRGLTHSRDDLAPLYVQPKDGPALRVGNFVAYDASWYPDGKHILFSIDGTVYKTDRDGKAPQRLFGVPGNAFWFRWSSDGRRVRFTVIDKKNEETSIWEAATGEGAPHRVLQEMRYQVCCGSWTPDGRFFLFQARVENTFEIWAQRDRKIHLLRTANRPFPLILGAESYRGPLSSKDGLKLFVRAEAPKGELVRYDSKIGQFIPLLPSISARTTAFSRDGRWMAYTSLADNQLWRCRADGRDCHPLTQGFKNTVMPIWSPDGRSIAFMGTGYTGDWGVFTVPVDGGSIRKVASGNQAKGYPDWAPDGQKLVYSDVPPVSPAKGIYVLDLRSNVVSTLPGSSGYSLPRWAPDGRSLIALHSGDEYLSRFDFASGRWRTLAKVPASYPTWSHDSKYVYFRSGTAGSGAIFRVRVSSGKVEKVASLAGVERGPFFLGDWIGMAADDSPLAVRNSTIEDIYAWDLVSK